jgi:hypothetical protein
VWRRREHSEDSSSEGDDSDEVLPCLRCQSELTFVADRDFHEGTRAWGFFLGNVGELFEGGTKLELWACENCGHVEFFVPGIG